jgi:predicted transcriptional regulator
MKTNSTVTAEIIAKELSLALRTVERNVRLLKEAGFIVRHGENKGGYWEVL